MTCRRFILTLALLSVAALTWAGSSEDDSEQAPKGIALPEIEIIPPGSSQDVGLVRRGTLTGVLTFHITCTRPHVSLYVEASDLYFGFDPGDLRVKPIPLIRKQGVEIDPDTADPVGGVGKVARFVSDGDTIEGYPTFRSEAIAFEAREERHFRQAVTVTVEWDQDDAFKPSGVYGGVVKLTAVVMPDESR
jgi:hypothetical protein